LKCHDNFILNILTLGNDRSHANPSTTAPYAHLGKNPAQQAAQEAAAIIATV